MEGLAKCLSGRTFPEEYPESFSKIKKLRFKHKKKKILMYKIHLSFSFLKQEDREKTKQLYFLS